MALRNTNGQYMTKNLYLAAFLQVEGYAIEVKREFNGRFSFWVNVDDRMDDLVNEKFYKNAALVEPIAFGGAIKDIKSQMYA
jgi:hypothetical protein